MPGTCQSVYSTFSGGDSHVGLDLELKSELREPFLAR